MFMVSCSTVSHIEREIPDLTLEEIEQKIEDFSQSSEKQMVEFDEEMLLREKNLIPKKVLLDDMGELSFEKYSYQQELKCSTLPSSVDLRKYDTPVQRQWNGTCTAFSMMATAENFLCSQYDFCEKLSEKHQWANQNKNCSQVYSSYCATGTLKKYPVAESKYWPQTSERPLVYDINGKAKVKLKNAPMIGTDVKKMKCALSKGYPVVLAMRTPLSMLSCHDVVDPNSNGANGGHAISIVGYKESSRYGTLALIKNSWGASCGIGGYQYVPTSLFKRPSYYAYMWPILDVELKGSSPNPEPVPTPEPEPEPRKCLEYKKYWCGGDKWYKLFLPWKKCKKCIKWNRS